MNLELNLEQLQTLYATTDSNDFNMELRLKFQVAIRKEVKRQDYKVLILDDCYIQGAYTDDNDGEVNGMYIITNETEEKFELLCPWDCTEWFVEKTESRNYEIKGYTQYTK